MDPEFEGRGSREDTSPGMRLCEDEAGNCVRGRCRQAQQEEGMICALCERSEGYADLLRCRVLSQEEHTLPGVFGRRVAGRHTLMDGY